MQGCDLCVGAACNPRSVKVPGWLRLTRNARTRAGFLTAKLAPPSQCHQPSSLLRFPRERPRGNLRERLDSLMISGNLRSTPLFQTLQPRRVKGRPEESPIINAMGPGKGRGSRARKEDARD